MLSNWNLGLFVTKHILVSPDEYMCQLYANFFVDTGTEKSYSTHGPTLLTDLQSMPYKNCTQPWTDKGEIILQRVKGIIDKMF